MYLRARTTGPLYFSLLLFAGGTGHATVGLEELSAAVKGGETKLSLRYRYELVDQDPFSKDADASTLKSRLTWKSGAIDGWHVGVEADYVSVIGGERYNSTENGNTRYPVVADPEGFDLNQAYIAYKGEQVSATAGRQRILHDDQRFVGGVGWRQNEQTYDAFRINLKPASNLAVDYSYVGNVNRIFGPEDGAQPADWNSDSHFLTAHYTVNKAHKLRAFAYLLDFDNDNGIPNSTATYGVGYNGSVGPVKLAATVATQKDHGDSPLDYDADFYSVSGAYKLKAATFTVGYEVLGSDDGLVGFRTPLATLHKFQGWTDKFLNTPGAGIEDFSIGIAGAIGPVRLAATWHDFDADEGSMSYGSEIDVVATYPVSKQFSVQLKFADYDADDFATDTTKVWLSLMLNL